MLGGVRWLTPLLAVMTLLLVSGPWCATSPTQPHHAAPTMTSTFNPADGHAPSDPSPHCLDTDSGDRSARPSNGDTPAPLAQAAVVAAEWAPSPPPALSTTHPRTPAAASGALQLLCILRI